MTKLQIDDARRQLLVERLAALDGAPSSPSKARSVLRDALVRRPSGMARRRRARRERDRHQRRAARAHACRVQGDRLLGRGLRSSSGLQPEIAGYLAAGNHEARALQTVAAALRPLCADRDALTTDAGRVIGRAFVRLAAPVAVDRSRSRQAGGRQSRERRSALRLPAMWDRRSSVISARDCHWYRAPSPCPLRSCGDVRGPV